MGAALCGRKLAAQVVESPEWEVDYCEEAQEITTPSPEEAAEEVTTPRSGGMSNHHVAIAIESVDFSELFPRKIYKVNYSLQRVNELEYEPLILSIGPYHYRAKERFGDMDKCKELYLHSLCDRLITKGIEITPTRLEEEIKSVEEQIRACYASSYRAFESEEFVRMIVLDGCFIVELLRKFVNRTPRGGGDNDKSPPIFRIRFFLGQLFRDLLLFENQLPLLVLEKLFELTKEEHESGNFVDLAVQSLRSFLRKPQVEHGRHLLDSSPHLLGLAYMVYLLPFTTMPSENFSTYEEIRSATALQEAGVGFKVVDTGNNGKGFGAVRFTKSGVLEMPSLRIDDNAESLIRNFIAYEQYSEQSGLHRVRDYFIFMNCLINTAKDVELLRHAGVISNESGNDEKASKMFNQLTCSVTYRKSTFYYAQEFDKVNRHCAKMKNVWKAKLKRDYFNSPWAPFSVLAAFLLLALTIIQTAFSVLSYVKPKSA